MHLTTIEIEKLRTFTYRAGSTVADLARRVLPTFVVRGVDDEMLLWRLLILYVEESKVRIFKVENAPLVKALKSVRTLRNRLFHNNVVKEECLVEAKKGMCTIRDVVTDSEREILNECIATIDEVLLKDTITPLPEYVQLPSTHIEWWDNSTEKTLYELKTILRESIKRRSIFIHTGEHRGGVGSFMMWNGNACYVHFYGIGKRVVSCRIVVTVLST